jgi:ubiquinone/menaquinone biosynthesis C-methylase UbiE
MNIIEIVPIILFGFLLLIIVSVWFRLNIPRKTTLEGIEDPETAKAYDRISRMPQFKLIRRGFVKELKKYNPKATVTDIGCGPGYLLQTITKELPKNALIGVDISEEMLERAKVNFKSLNPAKEAEFKQGSADHLPFGDNTQDFIISTLSLHHWNEPQAAFNEIHRVLKPGGQMLIYDFRRDARRLFFYFMWFATNIALRIIGAKAITKINEPMGSLLASYTKKEIDVVIKNVSFSVYSVEGKFAWMYIYAKK